MENLVIEDWKEKKFKDIDLDEVTVLKCEMLLAKQSSTKYLHSIEDKKLYTATDFCVYGKKYRCKDRKCDLFAVRPSCSPIGCR